MVMPRIRCAFLNCHNLFPVGAAGRGPADAQALTQLISDLSLTLQNLFAPELPHLIGLCEVGSLDLLRQLSRGVGPNRFQEFWSDQPRADQTGVALLVD